MVGIWGFSNYTHDRPHTPVFQEQELKLVELNHNVNSAKSKVCCTLETETASHTFSFLLCTYKMYVCVGIAIFVHVCINFEALGACNSKYCTSDNLC